jgi:hypothetical protein
LLYQNTQGLILYKKKKDLAQVLEAGIPRSGILICLVYGEVSLICIKRGRWHHDRNMCGRERSYSKTQSQTDYDPVSLISIITYFMKTNWGLAITTSISSKGDAPVN